MPSFAGLIGSVLKGGGDAYATIGKTEIEKQQKIDLQQKITDMLEAKERRVAEFQGDLNIANKKRELTEINPLQTQADIDRLKAVKPVEIELEVERTKKVGNVETGVLVDRKKQTAPIEIDTAKKTKLAEGEADRQNLGAYGSDKRARAGVRAKASDSESPSAQANAGRARREDERLKVARKAYADYQDFVEAGNTEGAKKARRIVLENGGVDPAGLGKGSLKVSEDEDGKKVLVHEDKSGIVTLVNPNELPQYKTPRSGPAPASTAQPSQAAVEALRANPSRAAEFDAKYGAGSSKKYLTAK